MNINDLTCYEDSLNAHNLEDWLNLDNELPTTEQMSDEQILGTVTGHSDENESSDEEDDGQEEKQVSNSEAAECFKLIDICAEDSLIGLL